jgi:hypothetical protein
MRPIYARWRAYAIDAAMRTYPSLYPRNEHGLREWTRNGDQGLIKVGSVIGAALWPVVAVGFVLARYTWRWMDGASYKSKVEREIEIKAREERIRQLEIENGIRPPERNWSPW